MTGMTLVHQALVYSDEAEFLAAAVPFLRAGLTADDTVLVTAPSRRFDLLRRVLGADADPLVFVDASEWYGNPARTIASYDQFVRAQAPRRVRALAEPDWSGLAPHEVREWIRYEAAVNAIFGESQGRALCAYNRHTAPDSALAEARRTHNELVEAGGSHANPGYEEPGRVIAEIDGEPLRLPPSFDSLPIESADLHDVRGFVAARAARHGLPEGPSHRLLVAVTELATNAIKHGAPPMAVRMWSADGDLICEVADCGYWRPATPLATLGFAPPTSAAGGGLGLWGVRMLTDVVQIRAGWDGTVVRLRTRLSG
jgi:anti-sigma regulatory factor (Ser/Thr protein kinase)